MGKTILAFPKQFKIGLEAAKNIKVSGNFDRILICAMGGSALIGDILNIWLNLSEIALPVYIHRDYGLPRQTNKKEVVVCISYSGNTEETLNSFEEARRRKFKIAAISSGGKLVELCKKNKIPFAQVPTNFQPRMALGFQFAALMKILINSKIIKNNSKNILSLENSLKPINLKSQGKKLAKKIENKIPIIYTSNKLKPLAWLWKVAFNENSKTLAFINSFPELNHNEISGFVNPQGKFSVIILRNPTDCPQILRRIKLTAKILRSMKINLNIVELKEKDILNKIFSSIILSNWTSYYLALKYKTDPVPVKLQEEIKKKMVNVGL